MVVLEGCVERATPVLKTWSVMGEWWLWMEFTKAMVSGKVGPLEGVIICKKACRLNGNKYGGVVGVVCLLGVVTKRWVRRVS